MWMFKRSQENKKKGLRTRTSSNRERERERERERANLHVLMSDHYNVMMLTRGDILMLPKLSVVKEKNDH